MKSLFSAFYSRMCVFTALACIVLPAQGFAQSVWSGSADNQFSNTSNWTPASPGAGDTASVNAGSPQVTNNVTVNHLDVGGGNVTITNTGALSATSGTTINSGSVSINAGGVMNSNVNLDGGSFAVDGDLNGQLMLNNGNVTVNGGLSRALVGAGTALSNNGAVGAVNVSAGATFVNNSGATGGTVTNAGTTSNAGTIKSLTNTAGNFTNNSGGTVTGKTTVSGGTVTNNFIMTDADVAAAAAFVNNTGATAGAIQNLGTVVNAGTIASLQNDDGSFTNNAGGVVTGDSNISGGSVANNATLKNVNVGQNGTFTNASGATAGTVVNAGKSSNAGSLAALTNTSGNFTNNSGGTITGKTTIGGGTVTNNFVITDADVAAVAAFVNNSGATAGAIRNSGTVTNAGAVASLQNDAGTFTNNAGGAVTGTTTVHGGSVINNATLADVDVGTAGRFVNNSGAVAGSIANSGKGSNDGTIAALTNKRGTFSNTGTINGTATVSGGSLINDGTISGAVDIDDGGLLSGSGLVGGLFVNAGGVLAPGPGIGTMAVNGDLTFRSGSTYQVDIDASGLSDTVRATGVVSIQGGTLDIRAAGGNYGLATKYNILSAGNITGRFDSVSSDFAFLSPTLAYGASTIDMQLDRNSVQFKDVARTPNGRAAATGVETLPSGNLLYGAVLSLDSTTANSAFSQLSGEVHASLKSALLWESRFTREAIIDEIASRPAQPKDGVMVWSSGFASSNQWSSNANAAGIDSRTAGVVLGADAPISDQWRFGGLVGYSRDSFDHANTESYHAGLYTVGDIGMMKLVGGAIYAHNEASTLRTVSFGTFFNQLSADYASATSQVFADLSWTQELDAVKLQPFANVAYVNLGTGAFRENGGAAALSAADSRDAIATSTLGLRWSMDWLEVDLPVAVSGMLGWRHIGGDGTPYSSLAFASGSPFIIEGVEMPRDSLLAKLGVSAKISKSARLTVGYSGEFGKGLRSSAAQMSVVANF
ncbi:autotransporter outer membrane beta-barrel domain-containing protein [Rhizobium oryziradicis]|uniref:Autotransporter outer membrane beta-barrel domain-containing protein n=1 Tax=Rhizobium oryziradicis TaxID=1867956 RepID=A0A1Q8ZMN0_9HYPH|nr:autotransporter domain-containing protein [Rhizobium oryziradicis]OLP43040.1 autotransporter outer membrane beta-barrel domain-containing protein [Rhizobium oryziradicis]